jgi:phospholipid/cholesterol/gamma-HCH transport system ATP-binding protein
MISGHIHELIFDLHQRPLPDGSARTSLIVTHDKDLLRRVRPRVVMLDKAEVCFDGPYEEFGVSGCEAARVYLQAMPVLHGRPVH